MSSIELDDDLSNTMKYEAIVLQQLPIKHVRLLDSQGRRLISRDGRRLVAAVDQEYKKKEEISKELKAFKGNRHYDALLELKSDYYLTTNYDLVFHDTLYSNGYEFISEDVSESVYSIHREYTYSNKLNGDQCRIWHIHGDINKPQSIMLGYDHYCGSIAKIDSYLKGCDRLKIKMENNLIQCIFLKFVRFC